MGTLGYRVLGGQCFVQKWPMAFDCILNCRPDGAYQHFYAFSYQTIAPDGAENPIKQKG